MTKKEINIMSIKDNRKNQQKRDTIEKIEKDVQEKTILETKKDIEDGKAHLIKDEKGNIIGANGGKYIQKLVLIKGMPVFISGRNEAELEKDYEDAVRFAAEHGNCPSRMMKDVQIATELIEAELEPDEELIAPNGRHYFLLMNERVIMDSEGKNVIDMKDIKTKMDDSVAKEFLKERFKNKYGVRK